MKKLLQYIAIQVLALTLPWRAIYWLVGIFAKRNYRADTASREAMKANLRVILGEDTSEEEVDRVARETFRNFGKSIAEFFRMARLGRRFFERRVLIEGKEHIDEARSHGNGAILVSAHLSNWEFGGVKLAYLGYPVTGIALDHETKTITRMFNKQRERKGIQTYPLRRGTRPCLEALRRNELICLVADRDLTGTGVEIEYFGKPAKFAIGPARFAVASGAPIVPGFMIRQPDDSFRLVFEDPIYPPQTGEKKELVRELTQEVAHVCENYVGAYPEQFVNFFPIWEEPA
jgi:lauroyl/myristoyl acyltransferase